MNAMTTPLEHRPPHQPQLADAEDHVRRAQSAILAIRLENLSHADAEWLFAIGAKLQSAQRALQQMSRRTRHAG